MRQHKPVSRVVVPTNITLTPVVLRAALLKLPLFEIRETITLLIDELDRCAGDPDFETDADFEAEDMEENESLAA